MASAPGKIILSGEHSVVHGSHAIATVVDRRTFACFAPSTDPTTVSFSHSDKELQISRTWRFVDLEHARLQLDGLFPSAWDIDSVFSSPAETAAAVDYVRDTFDAVPSALTLTPLPAAPPAQVAARMEQIRANGGRLHDAAPAQIFLMFCLLMSRAAHAVSVSITSDLPIGSGLGSSASFCSALATGFFALCRLGAGAASAGSLSVPSSLSHAYSHSPASSCSFGPSIESAVASTAYPFPPANTSASTPFAFASASASASALMSSTNDAHNAGVGHSGGGRPHRDGDGGDCSGDIGVALDRALINAWAYEGERLVHGVCSGLDNTVCVYGGVVVFRRRMEHPADAAARLFGPVVAVAHASDAKPPSATATAPVTSSVNDPAVAVPAGAPATATLTAMAPLTATAPVAATAAPVMEPLEQKELSRAASRADAEAKPACSTSKKPSVSAPDSLPAPVSSTTVLGSAPVPATATPTMAAAPPSPAMSVVAPVQPVMHFLPSGCIPPSVELVITNTRVPKDTRQLVARVAALKAAMPEVATPVFMAIDGIATRVVSAIKAYCRLAGVAGLDSDAAAAAVPSSPDADREFAAAFQRVAGDADGAIVRARKQLAAAEAAEAKNNASDNTDDDDDDNDFDFDTFDGDSDNSDADADVDADVEGTAMPVVDADGQPLVSYRRASARQLRRRLAFLEVRREAALAQGFFKCVGPLLSKNHELLTLLGVGHPALDRVARCAEAMSMPTKLTGAGGGGCAITLLPPLVNKKSALASAAGQVVPVLDSTPVSAASASTVSAGAATTASHVASGRDSTGAAPAAGDSASATAKPPMKRSALSTIALTLPSLPSTASLPALSTSASSASASAAAGAPGTGSGSATRAAVALMGAPSLIAPASAPLPPHHPAAGRLAGAPAATPSPSHSTSNSDCGGDDCHDHEAVTVPANATAAAGGRSAQVVSACSGAADVAVPGTAAATVTVPATVGAGSSADCALVSGSGDPVHALESAMMGLGFECLRTQIGQDGVRLTSLALFQTQQQQAQLARP